MHNAHPGKLISLHYFLFFTSFCSLPYIYFPERKILYIFIYATFHHYMCNSVYAYVYLYMNPVFMCPYLYMYVYAVCEYVQTTDKVNIVSCFSSLLYGLDVLE